MGPEACRLGRVVRVRADIPLSDAEARTRALPAGVGRLVISRRSQAVSKRDVLSVFARMLNLWKSQEESVYAVPVNLFLSRTRVREMVVRLGLSEVRVGPDTAFECTTQALVVETLAALDCEETALFWATSDLVARAVLEAVGTDDGPAPSHNAPFLRASTGREAFAFYAPTHVSLELLAPEGLLITRCLPVVLEQLRGTVGQDTQ